MDVVCSYVGGTEAPAAMRAHLKQGGKYRHPADLIQVVGRLVHLLAFQGDPRRIGLHQAMPRYIVLPIH